MSKSSRELDVLSALLEHFKNQNTTIVSILKKIPNDDPELREQAVNIYNTFNIERVDEIIGMKEETHGDRFSAGRDIIGGKVSGTGHVLGAGTININTEQLAKIPNEFAESLQAFSEAINQQILNNNIQPVQVAPIQENIDELVKETEDLKDEKEIGYLKKTSIKGKIVAIAAGLLKVLPKTAETVATFTPLAPFSKIIGEGVEEIVKAIQKEI